VPARERERRAATRPRQAPSRRAATGSLTPAQSATPAG
jgi:hypothetical protein